MLEARRAGRILINDPRPPLKAKNHARVIILISCYSVTSCAPCLLQSNIFHRRVVTDLQHKLSCGTGSLRFMFISFDCNYDLESTDLSCPFPSNMDGTGHPLDGLDFMSHKRTALGFHSMQYPRRLTSLQIDYPSTCREGPRRKKISILFSVGQCQ